MTTPIPNPLFVQQVPDLSQVIPAPMEVLRQRIGLPPTDTSRDADITAAWQMTVAWAERFLNRYLRNGDYAESFTHIVGNSLTLAAYPPETITEISDEYTAAIDAYHVDPQAGLICFDGARVYHFVIVRYSVTMPDYPSLTLALSGLFGSVWAMTFAASTGSNTQTIKSAAIDGMRVEFDVSGGASSDMSGGIPTAYAEMLSPYGRVWA